MFFEEYINFTFFLTKGIVDLYLFKASEVIYAPSLPDYGYKKMEFCFHSLLHIPCNIRKNGQEKWLWSLMS